MSKFDRLLLVLNLIRSRPGIQADELAAETGVSQRSIYRDILSLAAQYPIVSNKGYRMLPTAHIKTLNLTPVEYSVFQLLLSCHAAIERADLRIAARSLKAKIDTIVNPAVKDAYKPICQFAPAPLPQQSEIKRLESICADLEGAIENSKAVDMLLDESTGLKELKIWPYNLVFSSRGWLLVGFCTNSREFEAFRLIDIKEVSLTNQGFLRDENFKLDDFFSFRWSFKSGEEITVKIQFTGRAAKSILKQGLFQKELVTELAGEKILYTATAKGTDEIISWILGFGNEAEVLAPKSLREQMMEKVRGLSNTYLKMSESESTSSQLPVLRFSKRMKSKITGTQSVI